jgi:membrane-bound lytic murein transglycosylase MltF
MVNPFQFQFGVRVFADMYGFAPMRHTTRSMVRLVVVVTFLCGATACSKESPSPSASQAASPAGQPAPGAAAGPARTEAQPATAAEEQAADDAAMFALKKWTGDLDGMVERRLIRVLTTYSKTTFFVDRGTQMGFVPEAFRMFEDDLNKKLKNKNVRVHVVFVPVAHDDLIPALLEGRGDIVSAQTVITEWRAKQVDFTNPTRSGISTYVVTGPGVPTVASAEELAGKEVFLRASDVSMPVVQTFNDRLKAAGKPPVTIKPAPEVLADEDILEMVNAGMVPLTLMDDFIAAFWKQIFPDIVLNESATVRTDRQTAMMVRKNSPQLLAELNAFIARYPEGSGQRNVLTQKYLKSVKFAKRATSGADYERFRQTVQYIIKYSKEYDLDYLLMAAQGYQESGLDQNRKSPVGAIGVMQVMPATGADMKVGDITQMDPNIHAGVKYVRFMMDQFYANEPMDAMNKGLFTFASYNAGPGRVKGLRARAAKRGLDPNTWFNNVEIIASESIGRETVQYVSNIYKYYLAYKLAVEQQELRSKAKAGQF